MKFTKTFGTRLRQRPVRSFEQLSGDSVVETRHHDRKSQATAVGDFSFSGVPFGGLLVIVG